MAVNVAIPGRLPSGPAARDRNDLGIPDDEELKWNPVKGNLLAAAGGELVTVQDRNTPMVGVSWL